jgi:hypothetical protein
MREKSPFYCLLGAHRGNNYFGPGKVWALFYFVWAKGRGACAFKGTIRKFLKVLGHADDVIYNHFSRENVTLKYLIKYSQSE